MSLLPFCVVIGIWFEGCGRRATLANGSRQLSDRNRQNPKIWYLKFCSEIG
ncbi:hypothetical protein LC605_32875 [Nostoc sp. CHAB 5836]|uniref:hypothetical protein n=1 Tax=Nostoc sp. CHAB 5836 TaxID=2780404 RepID=UPI001E464FE4|nr:hypothetical protein [Nostoc sp. CHAB 5836]MCC5619729.1 hypothetical protein [Nostoc sp. CHAB 5836]